MTTYRLSQDGWVAHTGDSDGYRKYFTAQAKGLPTSNTFPIKDTVKSHTPVKVKLVSTVQDTLDRAKAELKHIKGDTRGKKLSLSRAVKAATSKKSVGKSVNKSVGKSVDKSVDKKRQHAASTVQKHKQAASAALKKTLKDKKSFGSKFVRRTQPRDVWGPTKW